MAENNQESKSKLDKEGFLKFMEEFSGESDRAAVILGAAKLDYLLYQLLSTYLVPTTNGGDELLDGDSPLATFSSKINISYRLGLIDAQFARALHLIRRIRNSFAHEATGVKLNSGPHRDRIKELVAPIHHYERYAEYKKVFSGQKDEITGDFYTVLAIMVIRLESLFKNTKQIDNSQSHTFVPNKWLTKENQKSESPEIK